MSGDVTTRVLLVDDEGEFLQALSQRLAMRNLQVSTADSGEKALEILADSRIDVVVLDLAMPGMDGLETLEKVRAIHPEVEIIMLTGHGTIPSTVSAMRLGADDYLEKPVALSALLASIEEAHKKRVLLLQEKSRAEIEHILKSRCW